MKADKKVWRSVPLYLSMVSSNVNKVIPLSLVALRNKCLVQLLPGFINERRKPFF